MFLLIYSLNRFFHTSITFTHPIQNTLDLLKSKMYKSTPLNVGRTSWSFHTFKYYFQRYILRYSYNLCLDFRGGLFPYRHLLNNIFISFWFPHVLFLSSNFLSLSSYRSFLSHRSFPHFLRSPHKIPILKGRLQRLKKSNFLPTKDTLIKPIDWHRSDVIALLFLCFNNLI